MSYENSCLRSTKGVTPPNVCAKMSEVHLKVSNQTVYQLYLYYCYYYTFGVFEKPGNLEYSY